MKIFPVFLVFAIMFIVKAVSQPIPLDH